MKSQELLIGILSASDYIDRRNLVRTTWGDDCDRLGIRYSFLIGTDWPALDRQHTDVWSLPCHDAYKCLPQKTREFCRLALGFPDWRWLLKTDDDSYISAPRLLDYTPAGDYVGAEWQPGVGYASGAGYFLSRAAATIIAEKLRIPVGNEDELTGLILRRNGIPLTIDNEHIIPFGYEGHIATRENNVVISHKMIDKQRQLCPRLWQRCHEETGLDGIINYWSSQHAPNL